MSEILNSYLRNSTINRTRFKIVENIPNFIILFRIYKFRSLSRKGRYNHYYIFNGDIYVKEYYRTDLLHIAIVGNY